MASIIDPIIHMWFVLALLAASVFFFTRDKIPLEVTSIGLLTIILLFGQLFPLPDANGRNQLDAATLLSGFANPALISVLALLVMGQAIIHTDALRAFIQFFVKSKILPPWLSLLGILIFVMVFSAFLNNTPLVVIAIPIVQMGRQYYKKLSCVKCTEGKESTREHV